MTNDLVGHGPSPDVLDAHCQRSLWARLNRVVLDEVKEHVILEATAYGFNPVVQVGFAVELQNRRHRGLGVVEILHTDVVGANLQMRRVLLNASLCQRHLLHRLLTVLVTLAQKERLFLGANALVAQTCGRLLVEALILLEFFFFLLSLLLKQFLAKFFAQLVAQPPIGCSLLIFFFLIVVAMRRKLIVSHLAGQSWLKGLFKTRSKAAEKREREDDLVAVRFARN